MSDECACGRCGLSVPDTDDEGLLTVRYERRGHEVQVRAHVVTLCDALSVVEDGLRAAGYYVPHESLKVVREDGGA